MTSPRILITALLLVAAPAYADEEKKAKAGAKAKELEEGAAEIAAELKQKLKLADEQVPKVKAALLGYAKGLQAVMEKHDKPEPDPPALLADVRKTRDAYHQQMKAALTKEQWKAYRALVDRMQRAMMADIAEIRLLDMKEPVGLSDEQVKKLAPVIGNAMLSMLRIAVENAGKRLRLPQKIKLAKKLKKIQADTKAAVGTILNDEQKKKREAYRNSKSGR